MGAGRPEVGPRRPLWESGPGRVGGAGPGPDVGHQRPPEAPPPSTRTSRVLCDGAKAPAGPPAPLRRCGARRNAWARQKFREPAGPFGSHQVGYRIAPYTQLRPLRCSPPEAQCQRRGFQVSGLAGRPGPGWSLDGGSRGLSEKHASNSAVCGEPRGTRPAVGWVSPGEARDRTVLSFTGDGPPWKGSLAGCRESRPTRPGSPSSASKEAPLPAALTGRSTGPQVSQ